MAAAMDAADLRSRFDASLAELADRANELQAIASNPAARAGDLRAVVADVCVALLDAPSSDELNVFRLRLERTIKEAARA